MANRRTFPVYLDEAGLDSPSAGDTFDLRGDEARHAATVRRHRAGETLVVADGSGNWLRGEVIGTPKRDHVRLRVLQTGAEPAPTPRVTVVQALPKSDRADAAVELLTEVGVDRIVPWQASRCVTRWDQTRAVRGMARWTRTAREAAKQSRRTRTPELVGPWRTPEVVSAITATDRALVLHETAETWLADELPELATVAEVLIVVG